MALSLDNTLPTPFRSILRLSTGHVSLDEIYDCIQEP